MRHVGLLAIGLAVVIAPRFAGAAVVVAEPTGDAEPAFLAELKASLETVAAEAPAELNGELRSSAVDTDAGVELVVELVPRDGGEPIRETRTASKASASAQARAMARELLKPAAPAAVRPPTVVEITAPPAPPRPALPRPPTKFRLESTAFAGLFWMGEVTKPTGGLDFGVGWSFAGRVGVGVRLGLSWVSLTYSCDDDECGIRPDDYELESPDDLYWAEKSGEDIHRRVTTTLLTLAFDLSLGNMQLVYVDVLVGLRSCFSSVDEEFMEIPLPYVAFGLNLTPVRNERVALLLRIDIGYYTLAAFYSPAEDKGLETHGAVGVQF